MEGWSCLWLIMSFVQMNLHYCSSSLAWGKSLSGIRLHYSGTLWSWANLDQKVVWERGYETALRSGNLQNRWVLIPHSLAFNIHLGAFFIYYLLLKCTAYLRFYLLLWPQTTVCMINTTTVDTTLIFSLPMWCLPFTGQNLEFEKLKTFSIPRTPGFICCFKLLYCGCSKKKSSILTHCLFLRTPKD